MNQHTPIDYTHFVDLSEEAKRLVRQGQFFYRFKGPLCLQPPLFTQAGHWIIEVFHRAKLDTDIGLNLCRLFLDAGLPAPEMDLMITVGGGPSWAGYEHLVDVARALLPLMLKLGVATAEEVDIETLENRLRGEAVKQRGAAIGVGLMSAWTRKD